MQGSGRKGTKTPVKSAGSFELSGLAGIKSLPGVWILRPARVPDPLEGDSISLGGGGAHSHHTPALPPRHFGDVASNKTLPRFSVGQQPLPFSLISSPTGVRLNLATYSNNKQGEDSAFSVCHLIHDKAIVAQRRSYRISHH